MFFRALVNPLVLESNATATVTEGVMRHIFWQSMLYLAETKHIGVQRQQ